jgi:hypothetical protein
MKRGRNYSKKSNFLSLILKMSIISEFILNRKKMRNCKLKNLKLIILNFRLLPYFEAEEKIDVR